MRLKTLLAAITLPLWAQSVSAPAPAPTPATNHEVLDYDVEWRLVHAGLAKLSWSVMPKSRSGSEAKLHLESTGLVSRLFHVNDDYTTTLNEQYCTETTFMTAHEGSRNRETKVTFDGSDHKAHYLERDLDKKVDVAAKEVAIPGCVHDVIGALYMLRTLNVEAGHSVQIPVSNGKKSISLKVEAQAAEEIRTPAGMQKTVRYEVFAFNKALYDRSGHLHVWLTDDKRHLPVQLQIRLQFTIGTITLRLNKEEKS